MGVRVHRLRHSPRMLHSDEAMSQMEANVDADLRRRIPDQRFENVVACYCASFHRVVLCTAEILQLHSQRMHEVTVLVITNGRDDGPCALDPGPALTPFRAAVWIACLTTRRHSRARPGTDGGRV